jgi:outer membrane immunogenic protein
LLLLSTAFVSAADLGAHKPSAPAIAAGGHDWSGFYIGAQYGNWQSKDTTKEYLTFPFTYVGLQNTYRPTGNTGGLYGGANLQYGNVVVGAEADVDFGKIKGGFVDPPVAPFNPGGSGRTEIGVQGSIRGRLGWAFGPVLVYSTAGLSIANHKATYYNWGGVGETFNRVITGYTLGGGAEYAISPNFVVRGEYRYTDYGTFKNNSLVAFPGFTGRQQPITHAFKVGAGYKF